LKIARIVTGSVADKVAPTEIASTKVISSDFMGIRVYIQRIKPRTIADMNVPANANVRIDPIFRKKLA
jgi:hypothetical protein